MGHRNLPQAAALANSNEELARQTARTQHVLWMKYRFTVCHALMHALECLAVLCAGERITSNGASRLFHVSSGPGTQPEPFA